MLHEAGRSTYQLVATRTIALVALFVVSLAPRRAPAALDPPVNAGQVGQWDEYDGMYSDIWGDGNYVYLPNRDDQAARVHVLDISDPSNPVVVSVALDPVGGSLDGEVNSHAAWPSEDGSVVVETEEDFNAWQSSAPNLRYRP